MTTLATLHAGDQAGLDALPEHDAYFDVDEREFDAASRTLSLPFSQRVDQIIGVEGLPAAEPTRRTWRFEERRVPAVRCVLRIRHVRAWSAPLRLDEPGMLNWIEWEERRSRVTIHAVTARSTSWTSIASRSRSRSPTMWIASSGCGRAGCSGLNPGDPGSSQRSVIRDTSGTAPRRSLGACPRSAPTPRLT